MGEKCGKTRCIQHKLTKEEIARCRKVFQDLTEEDRRSFILSFLQLLEYCVKGKRYYTFRVNGKQVCRTAWLKANSVSAST